MLQLTVCLYTAPYVCQQNKIFIHQRGCLQIFCTLQDTVVIIMFELYTFIPLTLSQDSPLISLIEVMGGDVSGQNKFVISLELPAASLKYSLLIKFQYGRSKKQRIFLLYGDFFYQFLISETSSLKNKKTTTFFPPGCRNLQETIPNKILRIATFLPSMRQSLNNWSSSLFKAYTQFSVVFWFKV